MPTRIVHLATTHRPRDPRIFQKECRTLAAAGHEVVYVVPGERDEVVDGVEIQTVPVPHSGRERLTATVQAVYERAMEQGRDAIMHLHDSDLLRVGFRLKRAGYRVVYDAHEDTPKQMRYQHWIPTGLRPIAAALYAHWERRAGRLFDGIITAEPLNAARFPASKTITLHNYPILNELVLTDSPPYASRANRIVYVGGISRVRGIEEMVSAVSALPPALNAELVLAGSFHPASLASDVASCPHVRTVGYASRPEVARLLAEARVGLAILHPVRKYIEAYPTKLFEYMSVGLPAVVSDFPGWRAIVDDAGCGLTVDPLDSDALAEAIRWLLEHPSEAEAMGARGRLAVMARYSWRSEAERLLAFYDRILSGHPAGEVWAPEAGGA